jgi:hypothetical protein
MTRSTVVRLFVVGLVLAVAGLALVVVAVAIGLGNEVLIMDGPDVIGIRPGQLSATLVGAAALATGLWIAATIAVVIAWVGAIINTASLPSKTWLVIQLVVGLLGFPFVAVLAYLIGRPEEAQPGSAGPVETARPAAADPWTSSHSATR